MFIYLLEQLPSSRTHNASTVSSSWWWAYKCPKHVEQIISAINHSVASSWFSSLCIFISVNFGRLSHNKIGKQPHVSLKPNLIITHASSTVFRQVDCWWCRTEVTSHHYHPIAIVYFTIYFHSHRFMPYVSLKTPFNILWNSSSHFSQYCFSFLFFTRSPISNLLASNSYAQQIKFYQNVTRCENLHHVNSNQCSWF